MKKQAGNAIDASVLAEKGTKENNNLRFFGFYYRFLKFLVNCFTRNYRFDVKPPLTANVYICRHKNTKGVVKAMKSATFDMHPFMLAVFQNFKSSFKQFYGYTFTKRLKFPKIVAFFSALFCALIIAPLFKSSKAIPTYRKGAKSLTTLKKANEYLLKGESIIIFPDVDYVSEKNEVGDIYEGFLFLEKLYFKKTFKHLSFVPLKIDDKKRTVSEGAPISFTSELPYDAQAKIILTQIKDLI